MGVLVTCSLCIFSAPTRTPNPNCNPNTNNKQTTVQRGAALYNWLTAHASPLCVLDFSLSKTPQEASTATRHATVTVTVRKSRVSVACVRALHTRGRPSDPDADADPTER